MSILFFIAKSISALFKLSKKLVNTSPDPKKTQGKGLVSTVLSILVKNMKRVGEFLIFLSGASIFIALLVVGINFLSVLTNKFDFDYNLGFDDLRKEQQGIIREDDFANRDIIHEALYSRVGDLSYYQAFNQIDRNKTLVTTIKEFFGADAGKSFFYWLNWDDLRIKDANNADVFDLKPATGVDVENPVQKGNEYFRDYYNREEEFKISQHLLKEMNNALFENYNHYINESLKFPEAFVKPIHFIFDFNRVGYNPEKKTYERYYYVSQKDKDGKVVSHYQPGKVVYDYAILSYNDIDYHKQFFSTNTSYYTVANKNAIRYLTKPGFSEEMRDLEIARGNLVWRDEFDYDYDAPTELKRIKSADLSKDDIIRQRRKPGLSPANAIPDHHEADRDRKPETGIIDFKVEDKDAAILKVVEKAISSEGLPYIKGSGNGSDNTEFMQKAFEEINVYLPESPTNILLHFGVSVPVGQPLQPGDIAILEITPTINGKQPLMYIGDSKWITSSSDLGKVSIIDHKDIEDAYNNKLLGVKRVITKDESKDVKLIKEGWDKNYEAIPEEHNLIYVKEEAETSNLNDIYRRDYGADFIRSEKIVKLYYRLSDDFPYGIDIGNDSHVKGPYETPEDALNDTNLLKPQKGEYITDPDDPSDSDEETKSGRQDVYVLSTGEKIPVYPNKYPKRYYQRVPLTNDDGQVTAKSIPLVNVVEAKTKRIKDSYKNTEEYFNDLEEFVETHKLSIKANSLFKFEEGILQYSYLIHGKQKTEQNQAIEQFEQYMIKTGEEGYHWEWSKDGSKNVPIAKAKWPWDNQDGYLNLSKWGLKNYDFEEIIDSKDGKPRQNPEAIVRNERYWDETTSEKYAKADQTYSNTHFYWNNEINWPVDKTHREPLPLEIKSVRDWGLGSILVYLEDRVIYFNTGLYTDEEFNSKAVKGYFPKDGYTWDATDKGFFPAEYVEEEEGFAEGVATDGLTRAELLDWRVENIYNKMDDNYPQTKHKKNKLKVDVPFDFEELEESIKDKKGDDYDRWHKLITREWNKISNGINVYEKQQRFIDKDTRYFGPYYTSQWRYFTRINKNAQFLSPIKFHLKWHDQKDEEKVLKDPETGEIIRLPNAVIDEDNMVVKDPDVGEFLDLGSKKTTGEQREMIRHFNDAWKANKEQYISDIGKEANFEYTKNEWLEEVFVIDQAVTFAADFLLTYDKIVERISPLNERKIVDAYVAGRHAHIVGWEHIQYMEDGKVRTYETPDNIRIYSERALKEDGWTFDPRDLEKKFEPYKGYYEENGTININNLSKIKPIWSGDETRAIIEEDYGKAFPLYRNYQGWRKKIYPRHVATYMNGEEFERWKERTDPVYKFKDEIAPLIAERDKYFKYIEDYMTFFEANVPYNAKDALSLKRLPGSPFKRISPNGPMKAGTFTEKYLQEFIKVGNEAYWKDLFKELEIDEDKISSDTIGRVLQGLAEVERERAWSTLVGYYADQGSEIDNTEENKQAFMNMAPNTRKISLNFKDLGMKEIDLTNVGIMSLYANPVVKNQTLTTNNYGESFGTIEDYVLEIKEDSNGKITDDREVIKKSIEYSGIKLAKLAKKYESIPVGMYAYLVGESVVDNLLDEISKVNTDNVDPLTWKAPSDQAVKKALEGALGSNIPTNKDGINNIQLFSPQLVTRALQFVKNSEGLEGGTSTMNSISTGSKITETGPPMEIPVGGDPSTFSMMAYQAITNKSTKQYQLNHVDERAYTDSVGLRRYRKGDQEDEQYDDYMVAMGKYYGEIGDRVKVELANGTVISVIIGDRKADNHTDPKNQYHLSDGSILEFIFDKTVWDISRYKSATHAKYSWADNYLKGKIVAFEKLEGAAPPGPASSGGSGGYTNVTNGEELRERMDILIGRDYQALRTQSTGSTGLIGSGVDYIINHMPAGEVQSVLYKAGLARKEDGFDMLGPGEYFDVLDLLGNPDSLFYKEKEREQRKSMGGEGGGSAETLDAFRDYIYNIDEYVYPLDPDPGNPKLRLTSPFGYRDHPVHSGWRPHNGLDIAKPTGANIYNIAPGKVIFAGNITGGGKTVMIAHPIDEAGQYHIVSVYMHMSQLLVSKSDSMIPAGEVIGLVGSTGYSTGPHLHFEIRLEHQGYRATQELIDAYGISLNGKNLALNPFPFAVMDPTDAQIKKYVHDVLLE